LLAGARNDKVNKEMYELRDERPLLTGAAEGARDTYRTVTLKLVIEREGTYTGQLALQDESPPERGNPATASEIKITNIAINGRPAGIPSQPAIPEPGLYSSMRLWNEPIQLKAGSEVEVTLRYSVSNNMDAIFGMNKWPPSKVSREGTSRT
jgi:hypothetical protein